MSYVILAVAPGTFSDIRDRIRAAYAPSVIDHAEAYFDKRAGRIVFHGSTAVALEVDTDPSNPFTEMLEWATKSGFDVSPFISDGLNDLAAQYETRREEFMPSLDMPA